MTRNDNNCTPNSLDMFRVQNRAIRTRFPTLPTPVVFEPEKVVKIWLKYFSVVLTENDNNCRPNNAHMFRVQNWAIGAWFSTLLALVVFGPRKVVKIQQISFSAILTRNDKNCTPNIVVYFESKLSHPSPNFNFACSGPSLVVSRPENIAKIRPIHFLVVLTEIDKNCTQTTWVFFRLENWVIQGQFSTLPARNLLRWCKIRFRSRSRGGVNWTFKIFSQIWFVIEIENENSWFNQSTRVILECPVNNQLCTAKIIKEKPRKQFQYRYVLVQIQDD